MKTSEEDERPWERPWSIRRDCEPHRGCLLAALGEAGLCCGLLSLSVCLLAPSLVGLPLSLSAWLLARRDWGQMRAGLTDPRGRQHVEAALHDAWLGLLLNLACFVALACVVAAWAAQ
jgi:hypothetical protein